MSPSNIRVVALPLPYVRIVSLPLRDLVAANVDIESPAMVAEHLSRWDYGSDNDHDLAATTLDDITRSSTGMVSVRVLNYGDYIVTLDTHGDTMSLYREPCE